jgi:calcium-translocating P-type ATPase
MTTEPTELLLRDLGSCRGGLGEREAARRLALYGANVLPVSGGARWLVELGAQFTHPLALLLWLAAGLSFVTGNPALGWAIVGVIGVNALVAFAQERQAARAVQALAGYLPPSARVARDGVVRTVPVAEIVRGDVLHVGEGDRICADARLLDGELELDMSSLTGESVPVVRAARLPDVADRLIDAPTVVFSGTSCTSGQATAVVFATGSHTELGRIAALSQRGAGEESPLQRQVRRTAWLIAAVAIAIGVLFLPLGLLAGLSLRDAAVFAVGLLVANVPEGLLPTITLALAVGVRVLARSGALVKRLSAVETLGSTTVICTDKTGTITQNQMAVERLWAAGREFAGAEDASVAVALATVMADCNPLEASADPMERALLGFAEAVGVQPGQRIATFRFDSRRKRMSVVARHGSQVVVSVKGAPESVLPRCTSWWFGGDVTSALTPPDRQLVEDAVDAFAQRGLRVLALAERRGAVPSGAEDAEDAESRLCLLGLVALLDPPRPEVADAVAACHRAGIRVNVITGDHARTAAEIARQVGIRVDRVVTGPELDAMTDRELDSVLDRDGDMVFARSTPEGKLRLADALRHRGDVVAMTGDGVNDAPALRRADIGVAMGRSGTDVAREAATMVLTDDDFATIVTAVREGRRVWENLRKFVLYIFAHAVPEVVPFAVFALSAGAVPLPLTVLQILAIDLGTETLPALALGREGAEPDVMDRPPRSRGVHLITARLLGRAWLLMGTVSAVLAMALFFLVLTRAGWRPGDAVAAGHRLHAAYLQATTITFLAIVACQVGTAIAARTERAALRDIGLTSNRLLLAGIAFEIAFAAGVVLLPPLQRMLGTAAPPLYTVPLLLACPVLVWGVDEFYRAVARRRAADVPPPRDGRTGPVGRSALLPPRHQPEDWSTTRARGDGEG